MVSSFLDLLTGRPDLGHVERQRLAEAEFPSLVEQSHMEVWRAGDAWPPTGQQVIWIGVAIWSMYDMELLDLLEATLAKESRGEKIYLFDIDSFGEFDFEKHLPGIGKIFHTPIVGNWNNGVLEDRLSGAKARDWLIDRFGLPPLRSIEKFKPR